MKRPRQAASSDQAPQQAQATGQPAGQEQADEQKQARRPVHAEVPEGAVSRALFIQATQALGAVLAFDFPADAVLSRHFRDNRELGHRDRGFIAEAVYGVLRRLRWLRRLAGDEATPRMLLLAWFARGEGWPMRNFEGLVSATERDWVASIKAAIRAS
jgi:16S rRNA (cytosine967-C5)-methyltransferase